MPDFDSIEKALSYIEKAIVNISNNEIPKKTMEIVENKINNTVYKRAGGNRTGSFLNSIDFRVEQITGDITIFTFNAPKLMSPQHTSVITGQVIDSYLNDWLDSGHGGIWNYEAQNFYSLSEKEIGSELPKVLKNALAKYGIETI